MLVLVSGLGSGALEEATCRAAINLLQAVVTDQRELEAAIMQLPQENMKIVVELLQTVQTQI